MKLNIWVIECLKHIFKGNWKIDCCVEFYYFTSTLSVVNSIWVVNTFLVYLSWITASIRSIINWLILEIPEADQVGFDPFLFSVGKQTELIKYFLV